MFVGGGQGHFLHITTLFIQWHKRIEKIKLEKENENITSRLKSINDKVIRPIGTE